MCFLALSNQGLVQVFHKSKCRRAWFKSSGRCYPFLGSDPILKKPHLKKKKEEKSNCPTEINGNKALGFWRWNTLLWPRATNTQGIRKFLHFLHKDLSAWLLSKERHVLKYALLAQGLITPSHTSFPLIALAEKTRVKIFWKYWVQNPSPT